MTRILITGASGFVGRAVCKSLRVAGYSLSGTTSNIEQKRGPENIPLYYIPEIGPDTDWSGPVAGADAIIHLAARVHVTRDTSSKRVTAKRIMIKTSIVRLEAFVILNRSFNDA